MEALLIAMFFLISVVGGFIAVLIVRGRRFEEAIGRPLEEGLNAVVGTGGRRADPSDLVGARAVAATDLDPEGRVRMEGTTYGARASEKIEKGTKVLVTGMDGLTVIVVRDPNANRPIRS